jgi:hypothetical protein
MPLQSQQQVSLWDGQNRDLGRVVIDRIEGDLVFGRFTPGSNYPEVERLFAEYIEAANEQLLSIVGELDEAIAALGLHLRSPNKTDLPAIYDVQIGAGGINFRTRSQPDERQTPDHAGAPGLPLSTARPEPHAT